MGPPGGLFKEFFYLYISILISLNVGLFGEEAFDIADIGGSPGGREGVQDSFSIAFGVQTGIQDRHNASVVACAQKSTDALFQAQDGLGQDVGAKPVLASRFHMGHACFVDGIVGWIEGKLINDHERERLARDIHALPEAFEAKEDRTFAAELLCQLDAAHIALFE